MWVVRVVSSIALFASVCVGDFAVESDSRLRVGDAVYLANTEDVEVGGVGDVGDAVYLADTVPGDNKPIHCQMKPWGPWSPCGTDGYKQRHRDIDIAPDDHGRACPFDTQRIKCRKQDCRVCDWKEDECDKEHGTKRFWREIVRQPELDGEPCPTQLERVEDCDVDCEVYPDEFDISPECDENGDKWQYPRIKYHAKHNGAACPAPTKIAGACGVRENCEYEPIPEDTPYGTCALDEESGIWYKSRDRVVAHEARNGGDECEPDRIECTRNCNGMMQRTHLYPSDGIQQQTSTESENDCCDVCKRDSSCHGFAFNGVSNECFLISIPDSTTDDREWMSAYVRWE